MKTAGVKSLSRGGCAKIVKNAASVTPCTMVWPGTMLECKKSLLGRPARERLPSAYIIAQLLTYQSGGGGP